jgi:hypothetical protein
MARVLTVRGALILAARMLCPFLAYPDWGDWSGCQLGRLERLPDEIVTERGNTTLYFSLMTSLLISVVFSLSLGYGVGLSATAPWVGCMRRFALKNDRRD